MLGGSIRRDSLPLIHTDWMSDNVLITPGGGKPIDWTWATPADAWTDPPMGI